MTEREFRDTFGAHAIDALRAQLNTGASPQVDVAQLKQDVAAKAPGVDVDKLLAAAVELRWLHRVDTFRCVRCSNTLDDEFIAARECPFCQADLTDPAFTPVPLALYVSNGPLSRSVPWLIAIHGFNTRGAWQEKFSWLIASLYRYPAPVLTYKYGLLRPGVLLRWRHRMLVRRLGRGIRKAVEEAKAQGIEDPPDLIAHSFGTQLFRLVLENDDFKELRFGRVITVGSVIRPDFDWSKYIDAGRVQAVLNQCGGRDRAVPWAQFTIPGAGPGGTHGFLDAKTINVRGHTYAHSTALSDENLQAVLTTGGAFERFLRLPLTSYVNETRFLAAPWRIKPGWMRFFTRAAAVAVVSLTGLVVVAIIIAGVRNAASVVTGFWHN